MARIGRLRCSFCGKDESAVQKLVAGPRVFIFDLCVASAARIMAELPPPGPCQPGIRRHSLKHRLKALGRQFFRWHQALGLR